MIRVAYLDHTSQWSGAEIALFHLLTRVNKPIQPIVFLAEEGPLASKLQEAGIEVRIVPLDEKVRKRNRNSVNLQLISSAFSMIKYGSVLARMLKEEQVTCIHTNSLKSAIYGAIAAKLSALPLVWHIHDIVAPPYLKSIVAKGIRTLAHYLPDGIIANSNTTLSSLNLSQSSRRQKNTVIYPSFAAPTVSPSKEVKVFKSKKHFTVLLVGRLTEWKGQHVLLAAAEKFLPQSHVRFWIAGDALFGEQAYKARLIQLIEEKKLTNVTLFGHVNDVGTMMQQADVLVHTSISPEPFGQVIVEGMAAGLPVIASNEGGPREIVLHNETGLLIPPNQPEALEQAIEWMMNNPGTSQLMSEQGKKRVQQYFMIDNAVDQMMRFYPRVIQRS
jgi:glycosyltransferase involved in cell wall biosynthesis